MGGTPINPLSSGRAKETPSRVLCGRSNYSRVFFECCIKGSHTCVDLKLSLMGSFSYFKDQAGDLWEVEIRATLQFL